MFLQQKSTSSLDDWKQRPQLLRDKSTDPSGPEHALALGDVDQHRER